MLPCSTRTRVLKDHKGSAHCRWGGGQRRARGEERVGEDRVPLRRASSGSHTVGDVGCCRLSPLQAACWCLLRVTAALHVENRMEITECHACTCVYRGQPGPMACVWLSVHQLHRKQTHPAAALYQLVLAPTQQPLLLRP